MAKEFRLENDLMKKNIPKQNSRRYNLLRDICWEKGLWPSVNCEICGSHLTNPQSIIIHQGGFCRNKLMKIHGKKTN